MPIFTVTFADVAVSAAQDLFELVAAATQRIRIREVVIGQYSDAGDAAAEILGLQFITGFTVSGSGGSPATPANIEPWSRAAAATAEVNNTTLANTGTTIVRRAETWNVQAGYIYRPTDLKEMIMLAPSTRLVIRQTAPADAITMNGTLVYEELPFVS